MPVCPLCPGRYFKDDNGVQMHRESKHTYACEHCNKVLVSQEALDQHIRAKHYFECRYCVCEFTTAIGRDAHEVTNHPTFECRYCDRGFNSEQARQQHEDAKHPKFECRYCDQKFISEQACQQHEDAKHPRFECRYCDQKFISEQACQQHEDAKHPKFECRYCDRELSSEDARAQHEDAKHGGYQCRYCTRRFFSETAQEQHEEAKHSFTCSLCSKRFTEMAALQQHEEATPHFKCSYCNAKYFTTTLKKAHEVLCGRNWATRPASILSGRLSRATETTEESTDTECTDEESESLASPSPSSQDEGEIFHSTSALSPTRSNGVGATVTQSCTCAQLPSPDICSTCQPSNTKPPVLDDGDSVVSVNENQQDHRNVTFRCTACFKLLRTEEASQGHVCAFRTTMLRPHCTVCYTRFDDEPSLQKHLEGLQSFSCQLCPTRCCSDEILQDHLLNHPTCGKCGKSFTDDLALCTHVDSDHQVVICWECDGAVVEKNSLELHYVDSPAHPTCTFCGVCTRSLADMDEHVRIKHGHVTSVEMEDQPRGSNACADQKSSLTEMQNTKADLEDATRQPLEHDCAPLSSGVDMGGPPSGPSGEPHSSPLQREPSLSSSTQPSMPAQVKLVGDAAGKPSVVNVEETLGVARQGASPSPTPSEHGSNVSRHLPASRATNTATNNDTWSSSPVSSDSAGSFAPSTRSSLTSSASNSVVFISADGIPDYIHENRAILVATSAGSPSSGNTSLGLSSSSLKSLNVTDLHDAARVLTMVVDDGTVPRTGGVTYRLHCRICLQDPCEDMTATICGHLFCKRCITQAVVAKSACPVCQNATLLYCLFKLDLSV